MSEFSNHKTERVVKLTEMFQLVIREQMNPAHVKKYQEVIDRAEPADVVATVDELVKREIPMPDLKKGINKALNLLNKTLREFQYTPPAPGSYFDWFCLNNEQIDLRLKAIRPLVKKINEERPDTETRNELKEKFIDLQKIDLHYQIKENVLFPVIEKHLPDYRCLQVMWSFHDDIRRDLKEAIRLLDTEIIDIQRFNRLLGDLFFHIYAIRFREERILFPVVSAIIQENELNALIPESMEIGFPFVQPKTSGENKLPTTVYAGKDVDLQTGILTPEQIRLIFNHLPVDITYVDENNKVRFFSTPEKRIFRRTNSIIGRDVQNCHPHESVHVVEQIVDAFRKGEKDQASFWIQMKGEFVLIRYFAVRDQMRNYKGVIEVTQEITEIRQLEGERRLLDWNFKPDEE